MSKNYEKAKKHFIDHWLEGCTCRDTAKPSMFWVSDCSRFIIMKHCSHTEYMGRFSDSKTCKTYYALYDLEAKPPNNSGNPNLAKWEGRWKKAYWKETNEIIEKIKKGGTLIPDKWFRDRHSFQNWLIFAIIAKHDLIDKGVVGIGKSPVIVEFKINGHPVDFLALTERMGREYQRMIEERATEIAEERMHEILSPLEDTVEEVRQVFKDRLGVQTGD